MSVLAYDVIICNNAFGVIVPIPTKPSPLQLRTLAPPAINEPVSAPAQPIPVSVSALPGINVGFVDVADSLSIAGPVDNALANVSPNIFQRSEEDIEIYNWSSAFS